MNTGSVQTFTLVRGSHVRCLPSAVNVLVTLHRVVITPTFRLDLHPAPGNSTSVEIYSVDICRSLPSIQSFMVPIEYYDSAGITLNLFNSR